MDPNHQPGQSDSIENSGDVDVNATERNNDNAEDHGNNSDDTLNYDQDDEDHELARGDPDDMDEHHFEMVGINMMDYH